VDEPGFTFVNGSSPMRRDAAGTQGGVAYTVRMHGGPDSDSNSNLNFAFAFQFHFGASCHVMSNELA
jgi:hypothetical protein